MASVAKTHDTDGGDRKCTVGGPELDQIGKIQNWREA